MVTTGIGSELQASAPSGRPGWLTFFAVTAIVVGGFIGLTMTSELAGPRLLDAQHALLENNTGPNPMREMQLDMQAKMAAAMKEGESLLQALAPLGVLAAVGLIAGGIGALQLRRWSRPLLLAAFALGLIYEGARSKPVLDRQLAVTKVTQTSMTQMMESISRRAPQSSNAPSNSTAPQAVQQFMGTAMSIATLAGMATALALMILKLAFLAGGLIYLTRPKVRALFG